MLDPVALVERDDTKRRSMVATPFGLASPFAKASDFAKASSDKSKDNTEATLAPVDQPFGSRR